MNSNKLHDIILSPLSEVYKWKNIEVTTLYQHARDLATEKISSCVSDVSIFNDLITTELLKAPYSSFKEFVLIEQNNIKIGMMCDIVTDDTTDKAIELLMTLESLTPGLYTFGEHHTLTHSCKHQTLSV